MLSSTKPGEPIPFFHRKYRLVDGDKFVRNERLPENTRVSMEEEEEIIKEIGNYVESRIIFQYNFTSIPIPGDDANPSTTILASPDWQTASKLLLIIQNSPGSILGIFSRSLCLEQGLNKGSMLPYIERALNADYGVIILRPNMNSVLEEVEGEGMKKLPITGSETPEIHALCVWENIVSKAESSHIALLGYANGAHLMKDLFLHATVKSDNDIANNRIKAFITIEASHIVEDDDPADIQRELGRMAVNLECNSAPRGYRLGYRKSKLGCPSISLGLPPGATEVTNVAASIALGLGPVFKYLQIAEAGGHVNQIFSETIAKDHGYEYSSSIVNVNPHMNDMLPPAPPATQTIHVNTSTVSATSTPSSPTPSIATKPTFLRRISTYMGIRAPETERVEESVEDSSSKLTVHDFDLLKIVGKGAFGKVLLVRKKQGTGGGKIYAMKILKKSMIVEKNQVEHAKSERDILFEIKHPYIVRLRFAFQSEDKLYLVTDYYNGGTLFYHLRKSLCFTESRARFYAAELLLALDHLHSQHIIYRDLKLENVLLDYQGHVALTDFGLSKQNFDKTGGATTFCGTVSLCIKCEISSDETYQLSYM
jgi:hypothetical protein